MKTARTFGLALSLIIAPSCTKSTPSPKAAVRAAAKSWASAFLNGSPNDILRMQGPECRPTTTSVDMGQLRAYLDRSRHAMEQHFERPLRDIHIQRVAIRSVTATSGEAEVIYDLPAAVVGNDNWVTYARHDGRWLVANCHAPIGGESVSAQAETTPSP